MEVRRGAAVPGVGRARELATIAFARDAAHGGRGSFLAVTGEAGVGKTWLLEQAATAAEEEGFAVGWGSCWPLPEAPPLWPWRQAVGDLCGAPVAALSEPAAADDEGWFERHVAVVDELRRVTEERPGLLVLDDAHAADAPTVQLARFVARHVRTLRLVVIAAHRPSELLANGLDHDGTLLALRGLDRPEVATVLAGHGVGPLADADLDFVVEATRGHPAEVQRVAMAGTEPVRAVVASRLAALPDAARALAPRAAVLDRAPRLAEVAALGEVSNGAASHALLDLERQHLAHRHGTDRITFASEHVRQALAAELSPAELLEVHARAVDVLSPASPSRARLVRSARHALAAAGRSAEDARRAVGLAQEAAAALGAEHDHATAASLLAAAREVHEQAGFGTPPAALQAAHGTAVLRTGHLAAARELFEQAARAADTEGDRVSRAVAAAGYGGVWLSEMRSPLDRERVLGLQRRALADLPDDQVVLRHRLTARLAAEEAYAAGQPQLMEPALAAARELGDAAVLAETLSLYHHTMLGPEHAASRLPVAREVLSVATDAGDGLLSLMGLCWLTVDLVLAGEPHAVRSLGALRERADALDCRSIGYIAEVLDVMRLIRKGRLDDAEVRAARAYETGVEVGDADALAYYGAQIVIMRWLQGRSAEVLDLVAETAASPTLAAANHAFVAVYAAVAADCGELDQARAALVRLRAAVPTGDGAGRSLRLPSSSATLATLFSAIEAAHVLGDSATTGLAARLLEPFADLPVMASLGVVCLGSTQRPLGLAALTDGDTEAAVRRLEAAVVVDERLGNRPMAALTRADLARALVARGRPGDRAAAAEQLDHAIREGTAMGLAGRVDEWRRRRRALDEAEASVRTTDLDATVGVIRRQGAGWILSAGDHQVVTPDLLGMAHLARLLTHPGHEIGATDLMAGAGGAELWRADQPVLDERALAQYRERVAELEDEIAEAEQFADTERAALARVELDTIVDELSRSTNVFGGSRPFSSSTERARTAVRKAVRRALDQIEGADPVLGAALGRSVRTGRTCCYEPGPGAPRRWVERAE